jgi:WD40 repeat protein
MSRLDFIFLACIAIFATPAAKTATFERVYARAERPMGHVMLLRRWPEAGQGVTALAFSPHSDMLVAADSQSSLHLLFVPDLEELSVMPVRLSGDASTLAWAADGARVIVGDAAGMSAWGMSARPNTALIHPNAGTGSVQEMVHEARYLVSPSGELAAGGRDDKTLAVWNLRTHASRPLPLPEAARAAVEPHSGAAAISSSGTPLLFPLVALAFSPDSRRVAAVFVRRDTSDSMPPVTICLFDARTGRAIRHWVWRDAAVRIADMGAAALAFSSDGTLLATQDDGKIAVWDAGTGEKLRTMKRVDNAGGRKCLTFVSETPLLASVSCGGDIEIWDAKNGRLAQTFRGAKFTQSLAVSHDGRLLAAGGQTAGANGTIDLWDISRLK